MDFQSFCMLETESLRTALARLNQNEKKILFLSDIAGRLTAALTDGDVRRYLLSGGTLEDSAANAPAEMFPESNDRTRRKSTPRYPRRVKTRIKSSVRYNLESVSHSFLSYFASTARNRSMKKPTAPSVRVSFQYLLSIMQSE